MIRSRLIIWLGLDREIRQAFMEGFNMACQIDPLQCNKEKVDKHLYKKLLPKLQVWRNPLEAWMNSDVVERLGK